MMSIEKACETKCEERRAIFGQAYTKNAIKNNEIECEEQMCL